MIHKLVRSIIPAMVVLLAAMVLVSVLPAAATPPEPPPAPSLDTIPWLSPSPNERIGVGVVWGIGDITNYDVAQLEAGWYADWGSRSAPPHPNGMHYIPVIPTAESLYPPPWEALAIRIRLNPGSLWLVGNEPEALFQENRTPAQYAQIYHQVYTFIKSIDPTAKVAIGGVILPSPLRLQWLDMVLQEYQKRYGVPMPVDVWNTHMQLVNEVSCNYDPGNCWGAEIPAGITANYGITMTLSDNANYDLFVQLVYAMRTWMRDRGFRNKPLIISEYGVLLPSTYLCDACGENPALGDAIVASFMTRTFQFMLNTVDPNLGYPADGNRLVQSWLWYTLNDKPYDFETGEGFNGALFDWRYPTYPGVLTYFGHVFKDFVAPLKVPYQDLEPVSFTALTPPGGPFTLRATVANKGNTAATNVAVRLYAGDPASGGVQVGDDVIIPSIGIRYTAPMTATFTWMPPSDADAQDFCLLIDPNNAIAESNEANNSACYTVRWGYQYYIYLPINLMNR